MEHLPVRPYVFMCVCVCEVNVLTTAPPAVIKHKKDRPAIAAAAAAVAYLLIDCAFCVDTVETILLELKEIAYKTL